MSSDRPCEECDLIMVSPIGSRKYHKDCAIIVRRRGWRESAKRCYEGRVDYYKQRSSNPEFQERRRHLERERYRKNPERFKAKPASDLTVEELELRRKYQRDYRKNRYHKMGGDGHRRWLPLLIWCQNGICLWCGERLPGNKTDIHVDHIIPISKGGINDPSNMQALHSGCNMGKGNRL